MAHARNVFLVALVLFNIIVISYCAAETPKASDSSNDTSEVDDDYEGVIGTGDSGGAPSPNSVVAGPIGGPVPPGAFDEANKANASSADTSSLHRFSALAGAAVVAGVFFF
ncbi:hypothetical protein Lal_00049655 [Lupinus albus]|uniref:Uncharacterized protein n=1 Tax=Lupinus albus TaxID=3870 RepID=A0A6A5M0B3_LUPAL|nr:hypothetical protein Lalb_Chr12g0204121 [Lupinus albus]KAF1867226.1 hypothetical protein Lal_00049655 [Lupinus albus]